MATVNLTQANFQETIDQNDVVLVDFWASWCGPCRMFGPIFEKASEKYEDAVFGKIDTEAEQTLAGSFGIRSIPTLAIFREQILVFMQPGTLPEAALEELMGKVMELDMDEVRADIAKREAEAEAEAKG